MRDKPNIVWGYSLVAKSIIRSYKLNIDGPWVRFSVSPFIFAFSLFFLTFRSNLALLRPQGRACAPSPSNHSAFTSPFDTPDPSHSSLEALVMSSYPLHQSPPPRLASALHSAPPFQVPTSRSSSTSDVKLKSLAFVAGRRLR